MIKSFHLAFLGVLTLTACTFNFNSTPTSTQVVSPSLLPEKMKPNPISTQGDTPKMDPVSSTPVPPGLQILIERAKDDLIQRISVTKTQIEVVEAREVIWPNSSLGCPQSGMLYAEVLTPGFLVLLHVDGQNYEYHAGKSSDVFYCENPTSPVPGLSGDI